MVEQHRIIIDRDVPAKMRDGVTLRADIFRPEGEEQHPVLLMRTPYDKSQASYSHFPKADDRNNRGLRVCIPRCKRSLLLRRPI